jgi:hypothetical protein
LSIRDAPIRRSNVAAQQRCNHVTTTTSNTLKEHSMEQFVFLFRKGPAKLSEAEEKRRAEEVRTWAMRQVSEGRALDPRILGEESERVNPNGASGPGNEWPVVAAVFLQASDFNEAVKIAKDHPGVRYGVSVEVRPWALPPAAPATR